MVNALIQFEPIYQERVWGGRRLEAGLGRTLPEGAPIGESWEIVDRPEACSVIRGGALAGRTLRDAIAARSEELMGPNYRPERPFPILVKWLDCRERLSLQVHPPAEKAAGLGGEPKTENWYIAEADPGAALMVGLKRGVTREQFQRALADGTLEACVHRFPVRAGHSILVRSGRIHAIDAGNLILEIQQNSDTTYRVYDWGRVGLDGRPRQLHVAESMQSIDFDDFEPAPLPPSDRARIVADCAEFRIRQVPVRPGHSPLRFSAREQPRLLHVVSGALTGDGGVSLGRGENVLLPFSAEASFTASEPALVLITENFV